MEIQIISEENIKRIQAIVESETQPGTYYKLEYLNGATTCTCPAGQHNRLCKHIVEFKEQIL